ncbi:NAD-dependent epimerase/dehydratase family protein [Bacillus solitudinis]|uniref:NAD-dependent epimerase/dehydratase family protein n=1 Tax=Bacillus solitudinis TaxID=2014074 RepID=UPI000C24ECCA|nr:NAD-dependent epimerase/dehydratase family protein [Bacillus solitudinis]
MKVLVTGGAGFIGSHIVDLLIDKGFKVVVVDNLSSGNKAYISENATFYEVDICSEKIEEIFRTEKPTHVIHQAAQVDVSSSVVDPVFDAENNILGTVRLLVCSQKYDIQKFIYASSCAVYGETDNSSIIESHPFQPISYYGLSKGTPEIYIKLFHNLYGIPYTILRYANVYGPRQTPKGEGGVVSIFINKLLNNESPTIFGDGEQKRDFVYVKDVATANMLALAHGENEVLNIGCNEQTSINQLYQMIASMLSNPNPPLYGSKRKGDIAHSRLDFAKAKNLLSWNPVFNLKQGLKETLNYAKANLNQNNDNN